MMVATPWFFFSRYAHSSQGLNGIFWSMRWCVVLHENDFTLQGMDRIYHGRKWAVRNPIYFAEVILTPSGTLEGPTNSLPMIPAHNITPLPPCWCHSLVGTGWPSPNHPELHPSRQSNVARHSSVNKNVWKWVFMYFWAHCNHFSLWALVKGCWNTALRTSASL